MQTFWDTSAIIPLLLKEPHTIEAQAVWTKSTRAWAWRWLILETEAALSRRKARAEAWSQWAHLSASLTLIDLNSARWDALRAFNRGLGLRAVDAAHLFIFERASTAIPGLQLVTFDQEMSVAADRLGLTVV